MPTRSRSNTKRPARRPRTANSRAKPQETLSDLLLTKVRALYDVETQLVKALPKMAKAATDPEGRQGFERHARQTEEHVRRLERVFQALGGRMQKLQCDAIRGLVADGEWVIRNVNAPAARDASLIAAAQVVEHYEMASYRSAIEWAKLLGKDEVADLLQETFDEERETSEALEELARSGVDERAASGPQPQ
ncbi:MAG TPA: ferritin-like domain-containing protein [Candidatus Paceibacterota bacterium]|nr:ferritin-like domain-containing protein [Candidatus Paceibacterota bacterium]